MNQFTQIQSFSEQELEIISKIITKILVEYQNQGNPPSLKEFCNVLVQNRETIKDKDSILEDIDSAFSTIDLANEYQKDLIASQKKGQSKLNWLKSTIKSIFKVNDAREVGKIIQEVQSALAKVNNQHLNLIVEEELRLEQKTQTSTSVESNKVSEVSIQQEVTSGDIEYTSQTTTLQEANLESFSNSNHHNAVFVTEKVEVDTSSENYNHIIPTTEVSQNLSPQNSHIILEHHSESIEETTDVYPPMKEIPFEGIHQQEATGKLLSELQNNSFLSSIAFAQQVNSLTSNLNLDTTNPIEIIKNYFESDLESNDTTLSKLSTVGLLIAKDEAHLPILEKVNATEIAVMADSGIFMAKVMYHLAQGKLRHDQAIEKLSDKVVSGASALLQKASQLKSRVVGAKVGAIVGTAFGPVGTVVGGVSGYVVGKLAGNKISQGIKSGANKVAQTAKKMVQNTVKAVREVGNVVKSGVKKVGSFIKNIFC